MKFPNYLLNVFAILGVIFVIFLSCSVASEDSVASDNSAVTNGIGKYAISTSYNGSYILILDTETGTLQTFTVGNNGGSLVQRGENETQP